MDKKWLIIPLISIGFGMIIWVLPFFRIDTVTIVGSRLLPSELVSSAVSEWKGKSFLSVYFFSKYRQQLYDQFPEVLHCQFRWQRFNRMQCEIKEKSPWVTFLIDGKSVIISQDGTVLSRHRNLQADVESMMIIRGISQSEFELNHQDQTWLSTISAWVDLIKEDLNGYVVQLEKNTQKEWVLLKDDTLPIYLGNMLTTEPRRQLVKRVFENIDQFQKKRKRMQSIDLRVMPKVIVAYE